MARRIIGLLIGSGLIVAGLAFFAMSAETGNVATRDPGELPVGENGKPLNLDFERGTLADWTAEGESFKGQPIKGPIDPKRPFGGDKRSDHTGEFWIGGFEKLQDGPTGTLTSAPFKVTHPYASFLIAGGDHRETRVDLVQADTKRVIFTASGPNEETLRPVVVDLRKLQDKTIFIRIVDEHTGGWGHVNFDDFRFHKAEPKFPNPVANPNVPAVSELYPNAGLDAAAAAKAMKLPPGFSVQVAASEPDVQQPIAMAYDERGRLWIAEAYEYPRRAKEGEGSDRILIFEDEDGDGTLEKRKVFAEGLNLVSGLEVGFGGAWVGAAPYLMFIPDKDADDKPDSDPQILLDGWGDRDTHETLNTFIWGPDGWLYGCHGVFTHSIVGKPGTPEEERTKINAGIWRYHPTAHRFEVFAEGTSNPWGVDFNDRGQAFCTACVIPHMFHIIQGARYERQAGNHFNPHTYADIKTIADHLHYTGNQWNDNNRRQSDELGGGHAHAGAMIYLGGGWPAEYRDQIFMNNIHGNRINEDTLAPRGSGYVASHGPDLILSRDQWSQILNLRYGPDGQVHMIDWYDKNQCHHGDVKGHDRSNGRIFRVAYGEAKPVKVDLTKASDVELVEYQKSKNDWYVRHARKELAYRAVKKKLAKGTRESLLKLATNEKDETRRLRALWALHVTGGEFVEEALRGVPEKLAQELLSDPNPYVRGWVAQLLTENPDRPPSAAIIERFAKLSREDDSQVVRLYLASAVQRLPLSAKWDILPGLVAHKEDAKDHNLPLMYWYAAEPLAEHDPARALSLALSALDTIPQLAPFMIRRIGSVEPEKSLGVLVDGLSKAGDDAALQLTFLRGLNESLKGRRIIDAPSGWAEVYAKVVKSDDPAVRFQATALALNFGDAEAADKLRKIAADPKAADDRKPALAFLVKARDPELPPVLLALLKDGSLRGEALRALAVYDDAKTPEAILAIYESLPPAERRDALGTLAARPAYALALIAAVDKKQIAPAQLSADLIRQLRSLGDESLNKRIEEVWGIVRDTPEDKAKQIAELKAALTGGGRPPDVELGRAIHAKTCQQCHILFGTGGKVGPDLTGSNRANVDYLLSNLIDPSAVMAREYQPSVIVTDGGRVITGIIREETADALTLQTPTEIVVVPRAEIETNKLSDKSMMPDDQLKPFSKHELRSLAAYLALPGQVPMLATEENIKSFFSGKDLAGWRGEPELWKVEEGEIIGKTGGLKVNKFLVSEIALEDFDLSLEVKLAKNEGNSGIQFRSQPLANGDVKGYQADIGPGWWGKLYEEHGREFLWDKSGESHVKPGQWNAYRIQAVGSHLRTWINGQLCVDLDDPDGARRGIIAFQLHSGGATEVRFRNLELKLIAK